MDLVLMKFVHLPVEIFVIIILTIRIHLNSFQPSRENTAQKYLLLFDHTTGGFGSGYLFANSTDQISNRTATLISPLTLEIPHNV